MKAIILCAALSGVSSIAAAADADPPSPDVALFVLNTEIPAASTFSAAATMVTVPAGKRLVVQSMTWYRNAPASGSVAQAYILYKINGVSAYCILPTVAANDLLYPGATLAATFYANAGTQVTVQVYRTGDLSNAEMGNVSLTGYYVAP